MKTNPCEECILFAKCNAYYHRRDINTNVTDRIINLMIKCTVLANYIHEKLKNNLKLDKVVMCTPDLASTNRVKVTFIKHPLISIITLIIF